MIWWIHQKISFQFLPPHGTGTEMKLYSLSIHVQQQEAAGLDTV